MQTYTKMRSRKFPDVIMKVIPGHFVTPNSHINYYIDMTTMKTRQSEAKAAARAMASTYAATTIVDGSLTPQIPKRLIKPYFFSQIQITYYS